MRAVRVNEFGLDKPMVVEEVDDPKADPGEIIVKNYAAGINASDAFMRTGRHLIAYGKSKNDGERKSPLRQARNRALTLPCAHPRSSQE